VRCAGCHVRVDPLGFTLEAFDTIGRHRERDLANRPVDAKTKLADGTELEGVAGLRNYLLITRRDTVLRQFCKKLLGYALGRGVQLSDQPLLDEKQNQQATFLSRRRNDCPQSAVPADSRSGCQVSRQPHDRSRGKLKAPPGEAATASFTNSTAGP